MQATLLDTHCWLWLLTEPKRFSARTLKTLSHPEHRLLLSVASILEISIKHHLGKLRLPEAPADFIPSRLLKMGVEELAISSDHAIEAGQLPDHHADPFDRLIIAQSLIENLPVLTADKIFGKYGVKCMAV